MNDIFSSSPRTPSSSLNSAGSQNNTNEEIPAEPIYSNEALQVIFFKISSYVQITSQFQFYRFQKLLDTLTEEFANENAMSYLEGTKCHEDHPVVPLFLL